MDFLNRYLTFGEFPSLWFTSVAQLIVFSKPLSNLGLIFLCSEIMILLGTKFLPRQSDFLAYQSKFSLYKLCVVGLSLTCSLYLMLCIFFSFKLGFLICVLFDSKYNFPVVLSCFLLCLYHHVCLAW